MAAGTHCVPVDASGLDLGTATTFQGFVDAEDQGTIAPVQVLKQKHQHTRATPRDDHTARLTTLW